MINNKKSLLAAVALALISFSSPALANSRNCLADVIYAEARGEGYTGQVAVAEVVVNRMNSGKFGGSICGVARAKGQFAKRPAIKEHGAYQTALNVAQSVIDGSAPKVTNGATYFHTTAVSPSWSKKFKRTKKIGVHVFYR